MKETKTRKKHQSNRVHLLGFLAALTIKTQSQLVRGAAVAAIICQDNLGTV
jgi:hypothetical protein